MKVFGMATVGMKGQVVIPVKAREAFGLNEGDKLFVFSDPMDKGVVLVKADSVEALMKDFHRDLQDIQKLANEQDEGDSE